MELGAAVEVHAHISVEMRQIDGSYKTRGNQGERDEKQTMESETFARKGETPDFYSDCKTSMHTHLNKTSLNFTSYKGFVSCQITQKLDISVGPHDLIFTQSFPH